MCLGVPGQVIEITPNATGTLMGKANFGGIVKEICLAYVPEAKLGDYVIVHAGFALNIIDEAQAQEIFATLKEMGDLSKLDVTSA
jgi:hydrogenase expression/formation protein HypC